METKGKSIQVIPSTRREYMTIKNAASLTKRSLASFVLFSALREANRVSKESALK